MEGDCECHEAAVVGPGARQCVPGLRLGQFGQGCVYHSLVCLHGVRVLHVPVLRQKPRPLRRAHRHVARRVQLRPPGRCPVVAAEARHPPNVLEPADSRSAVGDEDSRQRGEIERLEEGALWHGRQNLGGSQSAARRPREEGHPRHVAAHHGPDRDVLIHGAHDPAVRAPDQGPPHLPHKVRPHLARRPQQRQHPVHGRQHRRGCAGASSDHLQIVSLGRRRLLFDAYRTCGSDA
mmetsp:Transcript_72700/g.208723  ORF Transcript_72700/g.208723 Transcript_72700/m.208723 type:complete len:235 (-) Transcript_72700:84-788(-)